MPAGGKFVGGHQWPPLYPGGRWWTSKYIVGHCFPGDDKIKLTICGNFHWLASLISTKFHWVLLKFKVGQYISSSEIKLMPCWIFTELLTDRASNGWAATKESNLPQKDFRKLHLNIEYKVVSTSRSPLYIWGGGINANICLSCSFTYTTRIVSGSRPTSTCVYLASCLRRQVWLNCRLIEPDIIECDRKNAIRWVMFTDIQWNLLSLKPQW